MSKPGDWRTVETTHLPDLQPQRRKIVGRRLDQGFGDGWKHSHDVVQQKKNDENVPRHPADRPVVGD